MRYRRIFARGRWFACRKWIMQIKCVTTERILFILWKCSREISDYSRITRQFISMCAECTLNVCRRFVTAVWRLWKSSWTIFIPAFFVNCVSELGDYYLSRSDTVFILLFEKLFIELSWRFVEIQVIIWESIYIYIYIWDYLAWLRYKLFLFWKLEIFFRLFCFGK